MFAHLHVHSHYSLLDGLAKIDELIEKAKKEKMSALALTDHGVMYGAIEFYKKAKEADIKPIIGAEIYLAPGSRFSKKIKIDDKPFHLTLLAKNEKGYKNLVRLVSLGHLEGFYYKPRIDLELLKNYHRGLIALSGCLAGEIPQAILEGKKNIDEVIIKYQQIFGDDFYLEAQAYDLPEQNKINRELIRLGQKHRLKVVATSDVHFIEKEDFKIQDILLCLQTKKKLEDKDRMTASKDSYFRSEAEMLKFFKDNPEIVSNTEEIINKCHLEIELEKIKFPKFNLPNGENPNDYLRKLCEERLAEKYPKTTAEVKERLEYELKVIEKTGFATYFLIVQDFVNWAKNNKIMVGPGRGCFLPETKILLKDGKQKNIQDIKGGEKIITYVGNKRKVKEILTYNVNEEIAVIESKMPTFDLELTKDHKILAARHQMCPVRGTKETICKFTCNKSCKKKLWRKYKLQWIKAKDLKKNDFLVYPIPKRRQIKTVFDLLNFNNLDTHLKRDSKYVWYEVGTNKIVKKKIKRYIKLNEKFARLLGFYIAEGWSRTRRKFREGSIGFGFNKNEKENIREVKKLLKEIFGLESSIIPHKTRNSIQIYVYSRIVAKFFERLCGRYSENKFIPYQIFESPNRIIISFLTSLFKGDGSFKDTMRVSFDSVSFNLVSQVKMLLAGLGIMSSIKLQRPKKRNWHPAYKLTISGKQLFKFNELFPEFQIPIRRQKFYRNDTFIYKNYIWFPVKRVFFKKYKGKVYDLTVEKDSSYVANEIIVHNSAAGSIVSYILGITSVDPLKFNLLFERFLNPERISAPDIDLDFADNRRDEVIQYIEEKYKKENVAQIITFGTMAARVAVRDVGRVLGLPYSFCDKLAKLIPPFLSLEQALDRVKELKDTYLESPEARKVINIAKKLEGVARHASTHACGVVITPEHLNNYLPTQYDISREEKILISQYSMYSVADLGLLKIDLLGLKNLTLLETAIKLIETEGEKIDLEKLSLDDKKTFEIFKNGETIGVFQLESQGMRRYLKELKPSVFEDIIAMIALYRPGPMELIPKYIAGKQTKKISYLHPKLKPILQNTYGVAVYQEQILQIAKELAGFSLSEADILRKAIGKKIRGLLKEQEMKFIDGCVKQGIDTRIAEQIFNFIEPFAGYAFNRAHATCYATIAYQTAYLKAKYPVEFMTALLIGDAGDLDRMAIEIEETRRLGIEVLPPDVNESEENFAIVKKDGKKAIRFGLLAIKNIGENVAKLIIQERNENGAYQSLEDFLERVPSEVLNKKSLESLIKGGALDRFGERGLLLENLDDILNISRSIQMEKRSSQMSLFQNIKTKKIPLALKTNSQKLQFNELLSLEKEFLGLYVSGHPLESFREIVEKQKAIPCTKLIDSKEGETVRVAGVITKIKKIITNSQEPMLFVKIEDLSGNAEILVFPRVLKEFITIWQENKVVLVEGRVSEKDGEPKIITIRVKELT